MVNEQKMMKDKVKLTRVWIKDVYSTVIEVVFWGTYSTQVSLYIFIKL
jgi:hypothetical protein